MEPVLQVRRLSTGYGKKQVLNDVSFDVVRGQTVLISGGNGSGKSTLLKAIYGLLKPWNDEAQIDFRPLPNGPTLSTGAPLTNLQHGLGYVPQKSAVFDDLTVEDNLRLSGQRLPSGVVFAERLEETFRTMPALQTFTKRKPSSMSGGERQMLALAMVLLHKPAVLLLDEPLAGLSQANMVHFLTTLRNITLERTVLLVEHRHHTDVLQPDVEWHMRMGNLERVDN